VSPGAARDRILQAVEGAEQSELLALNEDIIPRILEQVRPESRGLIDMHHEAGRDCWIVSASPIEMVEPRAAALGMEGAIATRSEVVDGRYTGRLDGPFVYGEGKAEAIEKLADLLVQACLDLAREAGGAKCRLFVPSGAG
jgi:phosphoserine phosphatase